MRLVTLVPSRPAIGESLTLNVIASVGGSIFCGVERLGDRRLDDRVGDGRLGQAGNRDDVARAGFLDRHALEPAERHDLGRAAFLDDIAFVVERLDRHVDLELAAGDPAGQHAADEIVAVEQGREHLERAVGVGVGRAARG